MSQRSGPDMSPCERCRALLDEWRQGSLPPDETRQVEEHLAGCAECAAELAAQEQIGSLIRAASETPELPPHYMEDVTARVRDRLRGGQVVSLPGPETGPPEGKVANGEVREAGGEAALPGRRLAAPWWAVAAASVMAAAGLAWMVTRPGSRDSAAPERQIAYYATDMDGNVDTVAGGREAAAPMPQQPPASALAAVAESETAAEAPPAEAAVSGKDIREQKEPASGATPVPAASPAGRDLKADQNFRESRLRLYSRREAAPTVAASKATEPVGRMLTLADDPVKPQITSAGAEAEARPARAPLAPVMKGALSDGPDGAAASYQRGEEARQAGRFHEALAHYEAVIRATPDSPEAARSQMRIGEVALDHLRDRERARQAFEACLQPPLSRHFDAAELEGVRERLKGLMD